MNFNRSCQNQQYRRKEQEMLVLLGNVFYARMSLMFLLVVIAPIVAMAVTSAIYFLLDLLGFFGGHLFGRRMGT